MDIDERASAGGKYISVSAKKVFNNSDEIIKIYKSVSVIKGIISL
jgi:putative lipoic acid-binding regulatory protein